MADNQPHTSRPLRSSDSRSESGGATGPGSCVRGAFSLVELLIVLAIIATASAVAVPRMIESEARWRLTGAARRIAADIAEARSYAIASSAGVTVECSRDGYTVTSSRDGLIRAVDLSTRPYNAGIVEAAFGDVGELAFDGFGAASSDGIVTIVADGLLCRIVVSGASGTVKIGSLEERPAEDGKDIELGKGGIR